MTTYRFKLTLTETETVMLDEALKMMIDRCEAEIEKGGTAPFYSWLLSAKALKGRLYSDADLMSTSSFCQD